MISPPQKTRGQQRSPMPGVTPTELCPKGRHVCYGPAHSFQVMEPMSFRLRSRFVLQPSLVLRVELSLQSCRYDSVFGTTPFDVAEAAIMSFVNPMHEKPDRPRAKGPAFARPSPSTAQDLGVIPSKLTVCQRYTGSYLSSDVGHCCCS